MSITSLVAGAVLLGAVALVVVMDRTDDREQQDSTARVVAAANDLVDALQNERSVTALDASGLTRVVDPPVGDIPTARRATDVALTAFDRTVSNERQRVRSIYGDALETLEPLRDLRSETDTSGLAGTPAALPVAAEAFDRFTAMIGPLLDANATLVRSTIDDPELRRGFQLSIEGTHQLTAMAQLLAPSAARLDASPTAESIAQLATTQADLENRRAAVRDLAAGTPYENAADELDAELNTAGLKQILDEALRTGQVDTSRLVPSIVDSTNAWQEFIHTVDTTLPEATSTD